MKLSLLIYNIGLDNFKSETEKDINANNFETYTKSDPKGYYNILPDIGKTCSNMEPLKIYNKIMTDKINEYILKNNIDVLVIQENCQNSVFSNNNKILKYNIPGTDKYLENAIVSKNSNLTFENTFIKKIFLKDSLNSQILLSTIKKGEDFYHIINIHRRISTADSLKLNIMFKIQICSIIQYLCSVDNNANIILCGDYNGPSFTELDKYTPLNNKIAENYRDLLVKIYSGLKNKTSVNYEQSDIVTIDKYFELLMYLNLFNNCHSDICDIDSALSNNCNSKRPNPLDIIYYKIKKDFSIKLVKTEGICDLYRNTSSHAPYHIEIFENKGNRLDKNTKKYIIKDLDMNITKEFDDYALFSFAISDENPNQVIDNLKKINIPEKMKTLTSETKSSTISSNMYRQQNIPSPQKSNKPKPSTKSSTSIPPNNMYPNQNVITQPFYFGQPYPNVGPTNYINPSYNPNMMSPLYNPNIASFQPNSQGFMYNPNIAPFQPKIPYMPPVQNKKFIGGSMDEEEYYKYKYYEYKKKYFMLKNKIKN